jgi:hypothetical protein
MSGRSLSLGGGNERRSPRRRCLGFTRTKFERFSQEKIVLAVEQAGMPAPEIQYFDIHNYLVAG